MLPVSIRNRHRFTTMYSVFYYSMYGDVFINVSDDASIVSPLGCLRSRYREAVYNARL